MFDTMSMGTPYDDFDDIQCEEFFETIEYQYQYCLDLESDDIDSIADEDSPSLSAKEYADLLEYAAKHFIVG